VKKVYHGALNGRLTESILLERMMMKLKIDENRFLTVQDVADHLQVSKATVYGWIFRRILPHVKVGRFVRISPTDLAEFLELRRRGPSSSISNGRTQTCPERG
jgi:excisionase family DNA binding protein